MESQNKIFFAALAVVVLAVAALLLQPQVEKRLAPEPVTAWVAIETGADGVARIEPAALETGTPFRLHAVLEAETRDGETIYYTEAGRLVVDGEEVPAERLRRWDRPLVAKVRWFTVEGRQPFLELGSSGIGGFTLQEFLRSDWPASWSIPGEIDAANDNHLAQESPLPRQLFGTQRYQVRIELYRDEDELIPQRVLRSWGIDELKENVERFPTVAVAAPGGAGPASQVFGLTQLVPPAGASAELLAQIDELARHDLAFSRTTVVRDQIRRSGESLADLDWRIVDLRGELRWDEGARAGDLLRVGDRVVVLYDDRGTEGVVDYGDLVFDYAGGAAVRALEDVFAGEGEAVEWASLGNGDS